MAAPTIQTSFAAGEVSPQLFSRVDLAKYHIGAARISNAFVDYRGGISSRSGTRFISTTPLDLAQSVRLIKFEFSLGQTYVIELGHYYMRVITRGGMVLNDDGTVYVRQTPWASGDLALLKFAQSNDVMTFTHPNYPIIDMTRLAENNWDIQIESFDRPLNGPSGFSVSVSPAKTVNSTYYNYVVTSVDENGIESQPTAPFGINCDSFTSRTQSIQLSWSVVDGAAYYNVYKAQPFVNPNTDNTNYPAGQTFGFMATTKGTTAVDANTVPDFSKTIPSRRDPFSVGAIQNIKVTNPGTGYNMQSQITVIDPTGTGFLAFPVVDGNGRLVAVQILDGGRNYTSPSIVISGPGTGFVGQIVRSEFTGNYPGIVTYFQQRKIYAATINQPTTYWGTKTGSFQNFDTSVPPVATDGITFSLAALEQNPIKYLIPVQNGLIALTGSAAWLISGGNNSTAVTPTSVQQTPQVYNGCADVPPLLIGVNLLYVQSKGYVVQDLKFDFLSNVYTGSDRTYLSSHLFIGRQVKEWAWSEQPQKLVWVVMTDGLMLSMTYIPEQEVYGWAQHDFRGQVLSVCSIPEGDEDAVYIAVLRGSKTYIERFTSRSFTSTADAWCLDCALRYTGAPATRISGLDHLNGMSVGIVADGVTLPLQTVYNGAITLTAAASNVLVGLPFVAEMVTLPLDVGQPTVQGKRKKISAATLRVVNSRGLLAGSDADHLVAIKENVTGTALAQFDERLVMDNQWDTDGQMWIRGQVGLPWTVTGVIPEVVIGDTNG